MKILKTILLTIWQLPQTLVALLMMPFLGKLTRVASRHNCICYQGEHMQGGISLGMFCFVSKSLAERETSVMHELDGHTVDSKILGPLYLLVIGLPSLLNAWLHFTKCYYDFYTERWANRHAGLECVHRGSFYYLVKKK